MASKKPKLINGEIYHIYNRGVEKRNIFQQVSDYFRFIFCLYELNSRDLVKMRERIRERKERKYTGSTRVINSVSRKEPLVEIIIFCLMPNHYHLVLRQLTDNGISFFMKKLGDSYVGYFNQKYDRRGLGSLFQGRFKAVHVKTDKQLINLACYIFANPVKILGKKQKEGKIKNLGKATQYLESYRWSSYLDYIGETNFPSVTQRGFLTKAFNGSSNIKRLVGNWILHKMKTKEGLEIIKDLILE